jgi:general secretion pathway protein K
VLSYYRNNQKGSAIFSVLILLAVVSSLVSLIVNSNEQNNYYSQRYENNSKLMMQIHTIEDFAIDVLRTDYIENPQITHLSENWNTPINNFLIGPYSVFATITDQDSKLNINNLVMKERREDLNVVNLIHLQSFINLFDRLNIDRNKIYSIIDWIDKDTEKYTSSGAEDVFYLQKNPAYRAANNYIQHLDELLLVKGFDQQTLNKLEPFIVASPSDSFINVNTAGKTVVRAIHNIIGPTYHELLENKIEESPFININELEAFLRNELRLNEVIINQIISITSTTSKNFLLNAKVIYRDSYISFTTSISLKKDNETFEKYNRIIKKLGTI